MAGNAKVPPIVIAVTGEDNASKVLADVAKKVAALEKSSDVTVDIDADAKQAQKIVAELESDLKQLDQNDPKVKVIADTLAASRDVKSLQELLDRLSKATTDFTVSADTDKAETGLDQVATDLKEIDGTDAKVKVTIDQDVVDRLDRAKKSTRELGDEGRQLGDRFGNVRGVSDGIGALDSRVLDTVEGVVDLGEALGGISPKLAGIGRILGNAGFIGAGIAVGIGAVSEVISLFSKAAEEARKRATEMGKAISDANGNIAEALRSSAVEKWSEQQISGLRLLGLTFNDVAEAVSGRITPAMARARAISDEVTAATAGWNEAEDQIVPVLKEKAKALGFTEEQTYALFNAVNDTNSLLSREGDAVDRGTKLYQDRAAVLGENEKLQTRTRKETELSARAAEDLTDRQEAATKAAEKEAEANEALAEGMETLATTYDTAAGRAEAWASAVSTADAPLDNLQRIADVNDSFAALTDSLKENGKAIDVNTEKGRANLDALDATADSINTLIGAQLEQGASYDDVRDQASRYRDELSKQLKQAGLTEEQIQEYQKTLGLTERDIETKIRLSGQEEARLKLQALNVDLDDLDDKEVVARIRQQIIVGDYVGALNEVQGYYNRNPANVRVVPSVDVNSLVSIRDQVRAAVSLAGGRSAQGGVVRRRVKAQPLKRASGGSVPVTVGEKGREDVWLPEGSYVVPSQRQRMWAQQATTNNLTITQGRDSDAAFEARVLRAMRNYRRHNASLFSGSGV